MPLISLLAFVLAPMAEGESQATKKAAIFKFVREFTVVDDSEYYRFLERDATLELTQVRRGDADRTRKFRDVSHSVVHCKTRVIRMAIVRFTPKGAVADVESICREFDYTFDGNFEFVGVVGYQTDRITLSTTTWKISKIARRVRRVGDYFSWHRRYAREEAAYKRAEAAKAAALRPN